MHGHTVPQARRDAPRNPCFTAAGGLIMEAKHRETVASPLPED
jgi:hypothetical protein